MFKNWKPKVATIGTFLLATITWLGFFEINAKTIREQMTAHYLFFICALLSSAGFVGGIYYWSRSTRTTQQNIKDKVRTWMDAFNLTHNRMTWHAWIFGYDYRPPKGAYVYVAQLKSRPSDLLFVGRMAGVLPSQQEAFDKLSEIERTELINLLFLEAARAKFIFNYDAELKRIEILKWIPITSKLNQSSFMDALTEVQFAANVIWFTISLRIGALTMRPTLPSIPDREASPPSQA
jgi:hypothetical protein